MKRFGPLLPIYVIMLGELLLVDHYPALSLVLAHFPLLIVIYVGLRWNEAAGMLFGLAAGLTAVTLVGGELNLALLIPMIAGWIAGALPGHIDLKPLSLQAMLVLVLAAMDTGVRPLLHDGGGFPSSLLSLSIGLLLAPVGALLLYPLGDRLFAPPRNTRPKKLKVGRLHEMDRS